MPAPERRVVCAPSPVDAQSAVDSAGKVASTAITPGREVLSVFGVHLPKVFVSFLAGGLSGVVAKTAVAPFERLKIMFQSSTMRFTVPNAAKLMGHIVTTEGPLALFKGNFATVVRVLPYAGVQLMAYDELKNFVLRRRDRTGGPGGYGRLTGVEKIVCGGGAGAASVISTYPLDLIRARLAVQRHNPQVHGLVHGLVAAFREQGIRSLYRGLAPSLLGILPYGGLAFGTFETLKQWSYDRTGKSPSATERLLYGGFAGLVGQCFVYPLDVTRRRLQTAGFVEGNKARGMMPTLKYIHNTEGLRGLFKGVSLNFVKGPIAVGISFTVFDFLKKRWGVDHYRRH